MYESDEWYVQYELDKDPRVLTKTRGQTKVNSVHQTIADTEDDWDLDASASDNESYEIEMETQMES